jgi:hypothetical protein
MNQLVQQGGGREGVVDDAGEVYPNILDAFGLNAIGTKTNDKTQNPGVYLPTNDNNYDGSKIT